MTRLLIVRHGATQAIEKHILQGITDSPLSQQGRQQSEITALTIENRSIIHCYSSPLGRALETARILCAPLGLEPEINNEMREISFGWMENTHFNFIPHEKRSQIQKISSFVRFFLVAQYTGERRTHLSQRAFTVWNFLKTQAEAGDILIVSHGVFISALLEEIFHEDPSGVLNPNRVDACSITEIELMNQKPVLVKLNDTSHLNTL